MVRGRLGAAPAHRAPALREARRQDLCEERDGLRRTRPAPTSRYRTAMKRSFVTEIAIQALEFLGFPRISWDFLAWNSWHGPSLCSPPVILDAEAQGARTLPLYVTI